MERCISSYIHIYYRFKRITFVGLLHCEQLEFLGCNLWLHVTFIMTFLKNNNFKAIYKQKIIQNLLFQIESSWSTAEYWLILVFLHRNVWAFSYIVFILISNECSIISRAIDDQITQTASILSYNSRCIDSNISFISVYWRYCVLYGIISSLETIRSM